MNYFELEKLNQTINTILCLYMINKLIGSNGTVSMLYKDGKVRAGKEYLAALS